MIYIGKRSSKKHPDIDTYFGSGIRLKHAIKKYGKDNFKKEIISIVDSAEELEELEEMIVDADFIARKDTYNIALGGKGGNLGESVNKKISEALKGKKHGPMTDEQKYKISKANKGNKHTDSTKMKLSEVNKYKKLSKETKAKISKAKTGVLRAPFSADHRAKISDAMKGKRLTEEHKAKISKAMGNRNHGKTKTIQISPKK